MIIRQDQSYTKAKEMQFKTSTTGTKFSLEGGGRLDQVLITLTVPA